MSSTPNPLIDKTASKTTVQSAPPAKPSTEEERRQRYADLRKRMGRSRLEVKGDPAKHYFWASKDDSLEMTRLDYLGYEVVREADPKKPTITAAGMKDDGTYIIGDVILMCCPMETYEFLMLDNEERSNSLVTSAKENFKHEAAQRGVPTFEVTKPVRG
jgi:hypothetical protein